MKTAYLILALVLSSSLAFSDDLIIKKDGERIRCVIQKEDSLSVVYALHGRKRQTATHEIKKIEIDSIERDYNISMPGVKTKKEESPSIILCLNFHREYERFLGLNLEFPIVDYLGAHFCGGLLGAGAGLDFHISPSIRSSSFNISYLYMNYNSDNKSSIVASFTFRTKYYFQLQAGAAYHTSREVEGYGIFNGDFQQAPAVSLLLGIGFYYPF